MRYPAYLEVGPEGDSLAYVFLLPGLQALEASPEAALAALPQAVTEEIARLARHERPWPWAAEPVEIVETERIAVTGDVRQGKSSALFRYELRPTRAEDVALALDRLELSRRDLLAALEALRMARGDDWESVREGPDSPQAGETARRAADGELWLLTRLGSGIEMRLPEAPLERLEAVRARTIERLANLLPGDLERHAVFAGEPWTTRKVLRRLVCHERVHGHALARLAPAESAW